MRGVPDLWDYGGDPNETAAQSALRDSSDALEAFRLACNEHKVVGDAPIGRYLVSRDTGPYIHSGIRGQYAGPNASDDTDGEHGKNKTTIVLGDDMEGDTPWATFATGTAVAEIAGLYRDVYWDTIPVTVTKDGDGYVTDVDGAPVPYAPFIKSEHYVTDAGVVTANSRNGGRIRIDNIEAMGAYDGIWIRDDDETDQKGIQNVRIDGFYGMCLRHDIVLGRVSGTSFVQNVSTTEGVYQPGKSDNPLDRDDEDERVIMWRRRNGVCLWLRNRAAGLRADNVSTRDALARIRISGGYRGEPDNPEDPVEDWTYPLPYRGLRGGRVNGLVDTRGGGEQCRHNVLIDEDGYMNRCSFEISGHAVDDDDPTWQGFAVQINTDRDIAGNIKKAKNTGEEDDEFKAMGTLRGWTADFKFLTQESDGGLIFSAENDGHGELRVSGTAVSIGQKIPDSAVFVIEDGSRARIVGRMSLLSTKRGVQTVADVPSPPAAYLDLRGSTISGFAQLFLDTWTPRPFDVINEQDWVQTPSETDEIDDGEEA